MSAPKTFDRHRHCAWCRALVTGIRPVVINGRAIGKTAERLIQGTVTVVVSQTGAAGPARSRVCGSCAAVLRDYLLERNLVPDDHSWVGPAEVAS